MSRETDRMLIDLETPLSNDQVDKLRAEMQQVASLREVADSVVGIVVAALAGSGADDEDVKKMLHMIIIKLQEIRDAP